MEVPALWDSLQPVLCCVCLTQGHLLSESASRVFSSALPPLGDRNRLCLFQVHLALLLTLLHGQHPAGRHPCLQQSIPLCPEGAAVSVAVQRAQALAVLWLETQYRVEAVQSFPGGGEGRYRLCAAV